MPAEELPHFKGSVGAGTEAPISVPSDAIAVPPTSKNLHGKIPRTDYFTVLFFSTSRQKLK